LPALTILILFSPAPAILTLSLLIPTIPILSLLTPIILVPSLLALAIPTPSLPALIILTPSLPAPSILALFLPALPNIIYNLIGRRLPHNFNFININNLNMFNVELEAEFKWETYFDEKLINSIFKV